MRRSSDSKFKTKVGLEAIKEKLAIREIAQKYEVQPSQVQQWKKSLLDNIGHSFSSKREKETKDQEQLIQELYRQIGKLKIENDFLKKLKLFFIGEERPN